VLQPLYEAAGLEVVVQEDVRDGVRHQNLLGTYRGADPGGLLLVTHLDTVDSGPPELWSETDFQPHSLAKKGDKVYGLGSADTKLDALCKLFAARELKGKPLRRSLQLLGTYEEEVGAKGAKHFIRSDLFQARYVACSEPSELVIIRAHKGYAVVVVDLEMSESPPLEGGLEEIVVEGKAAHSSTPHLGINAIERSLGILDGVGPLASLEGGSVSNKVPARCTLVLQGSALPGKPVQRTNARDATATAQLAKRLFELWKSLAMAQKPESNAAFDPAKCVVNWGVARIDGPHARLTFDCRLLPGHDPDALTSRFIAEGKQEAKRAGASRFEVTVDRASPAMELKEPSTLLDAARAACRDVGLPDAPQAKPTNTEAGVFARAGAESIVFGPGRSTGNAHCANEHNQYSQMEKAIEFYRALIARLCV
jgi:acetylornithine deacetylase/succinyl-diaminopimelate desuccinylase-like protein